MLKPLPLFSSLKFVAPFLHLQHSPTPPRFLLHSTASTLTRVPSNFARASSSFMQPPTEMDSESYMFGPCKINPREVFHSTQLSYALVNLSPLVPGHVLVCPRREVKHFLDLSADETSDLWVTAQKVGSQIESYHNSSSLTFAIQDGPQAGQSVPHVHIHILPAKVAILKKKDEIYDAIDLKEKELKKKLDLDKERKDRSIAEMIEEADEYRKLFLYESLVLSLWKFQGFGVNYDQIFCQFEGSIVEMIEEADEYRAFSLRIFSVEFMEIQGFGVIYNKTFCQFEGGFFRFL